MISSIANSLGFGSGIDTAQLVNDLAMASSQPKLDRIKSLANANQARISAVAQARSDLESFASSLADVVAEGSLRSQPILSNSNVLDATAQAGVRLGNLASTIEIAQLARGQTIYSTPVGDAASPLGQGSMTLTIGGSSHQITVDATHDSLNGLRDAINASDSGVTASIVTDSAGARLILKGESGEARAFTLSVDAGSDPGLDRFAYPVAGSGMTLGQAAQNALFTVDGVAYSRTTNTVGDVIPGVNLTLKQPTAGAPVNIAATRPTEALRQTINDFVGVFNALKADIAKARSATGASHALGTLDRQLNALLGQAVTSDPETNSLADIGIATNRDGSIRIDAARLEKALSTNPDAVEAIFNPLRDASHDDATDPGISLALSGMVKQMTANDGVLDTLGNRLQREADQISERRTAIEAREDAYRARLERQFSGMDAKLGALKATQTYLEQQIKLWSGNND